MDELTKSIQDGAPRWMMFADDAVLVNENINLLEGKIERWREALWVTSMWITCLS